MYPDITHPFHAGILQLNLAIITDKQFSRVPRAGYGYGFLFVLCHQQAIYRQGMVILHRQAHAFLQRDRCAALDLNIRV